MTTEAASRDERMRLFYHPVSSASMRVTLYLRCRGVPASMVELVSTGLETDHRGDSCLHADKCEVYATLRSPG